MTKVQLRVIARSKAMKQISSLLSLRGELARRGNPVPCCRCEDRDEAISKN